MENHVQFLSGVSAGAEALLLAPVWQQHKQVLFLVPNETRLAFLRDVFRLTAPKRRVMTLSAWDTVPYDRTAPAPEIVGRRVDTLTALAEQPDQPFILIATVSAWLQRVPEPAFFRQGVRHIRVGETISFDALRTFLTHVGYRPAETVMESGDFAVRGGLIDVFPAGAEMPVRLDFFGDEVDSMRRFDPVTQRTTQATDTLTLKPMREFILTPETVSHFRARYRELFDRHPDDVFYQAVSENRYVQGLEHFLPLFHTHMATVGDYVPQATVLLDFQAREAAASRREQIGEYYDARVQALAAGTGPVYQPVPPDLMFQTAGEATTWLAARPVFELTPFNRADGQDMGGRAGHDFAEARVQGQGDIFDTVADFVRSSANPVIMTAATDGSCQRLAGLMRDRGVALTPAETFAGALKKTPAILTAPFEQGFRTRDFIVITETDILGERIIRPVKKRKNPDFIADLTALNPGDLVVHQTHGIGRFAGLVPLNIAGAAHDCLCLEYDGGDKLFVPVENADVLSRYGNAEGVALDRLGGTAFATRKERVKKDLFQMAAHLMDIASERALNHTEKILAPHGLYQEFCARFPYSETDDQLRTIGEIETDLAAGKPMDRLVCGDVGFGKTEVAMRAAFLAVMAGYQVAVIVPTTLLARQHTRNFTERFAGFPIRVAGLSRLVSHADTQKIHAEMKQGTADIIIGTHALLARGVSFKNLGLVIVDEEQHFGVAHKERLKELKHGVHVLTLTATPIPRTLQLSLAGVRELSVIATPPVDRLAVKTFITPFDPVIIKEAVLREHFRGGQTFVVCPRISDMAEVADILAKLVPDIRVVQAHGQMAAGKLESIMTAFADKKYDVLLATSIVESGLDMPTVNTMIVYRADMFGLAALYQLRGRVGRGKLRAYAYLTTPAHGRISDTAQKRLTVMQGLDSLGAGFALASHDLDIRGAGNLLGREQSGHIREVGVALYQKMLGDAIRALRQKGPGDKTVPDDYSPQISVGLPVLIPDSYIADLDVRMNLYHRLSDMTDVAEVDSLRAELTDRFGPYPKEVENLLQTIELKIWAKAVHIERLEAGPKGASVSFHNNTFPNPAGLVAYINAQMGTVRLRPDQKMIVMRPWPTPDGRLTGIRNLIRTLAEIVGDGKTPNVPPKKC